MLARMEAWLKRLRLLLPLVSRFFPKLAVWSAVAYAVIDMVLMIIRSWPW